MGSRRIFIAIDISDEARHAAATYIDGLRRQFPDVRAGWERPEKLHFTLKFLGHVDEAIIPAGQAALDSILKKHQPFTAELSGTGVFPNKRQPRILWLGMDRGREEMVSLGTSIETAVEHLGFKKDQRLYSPHLTVARLRDPRNCCELAEAHLNGIFQPVEFAVSSVTVYESTLGSHGSSYDMVSQHSLGEIGRR